MAEGAVLAGIIQSPGNYEPETNPQAVQARFDYVVSGMQAQGWLTAAEARALTLPAFVQRDTSNKLGGQTGYLAAEVRAELLANGFTDAEIDTAGLRITTTIDPAAQRSLQTAVADQGPQSDTEGVRIGAASVDPASGAILALYGGSDYVSSPLNNATQATAQAGSTFKPFALAAAFEQGISPYSRWNGNSPRTIAGYTLQNEGNRDYGTVTLQRATEKSINTPFVSLANTVGIDKVIDAAYRAGLPQDTAGVNRDLTFVLGSASPTPLDMASAYATFAARGTYHKPFIVREVANGEGEVLYRATIAGEQRFEADVADQVNAALQRVVTNGTASSAQSVGRPLAGKTGTTDDNKSAWFVGYGPQVSTAVMMSKEDANGSPVSLRGTGGRAKVYGSSFPLGIWTAQVAGYLDGKPVEQFVRPERSASPRTYGSGSSQSNTWRPQRSATPAPSVPVTPEGPEAELPPADGKPAAPPTNPDPLPSGPGQSGPGDPTPGAGKPGGNGGAEPPAENPAAAGRSVDVPAEEAAA